MSGQKFQSLVCVVFILFSVPLMAKTQFYAHRGGRALWPENTLCAFEQALKTKVNFIDMDVQFSKDGVMMVTHNSGLDKDLTQKNGQWITKKTPIRDLSANELQQLELGQLKPNSKTAKAFPKQQAMPNCYMPTLAQSIDYIKLLDTKGVGFQIEIKVPNKLAENEEIPKKYAKQIVSLLKNKRIISRSEVQSFDFRVLSEISKLEPKVTLAFLTEKQPGNAKLFKQIRTLNGKLWEPAFEDVTKESIQLAHLMDLRVVVWGLPLKPEQELQAMRQLLSLGVDGIITDNPALINKLYLNS